MNGIVTDFMGTNATVQSLVAEYMSYPDVTPITALGCSSADASQGGQNFGGSILQTAATAMQGEGKGSGIMSTGGRALVDPHARQVCAHSTVESGKVLCKCRVPRLPSKKLCILVDESNLQERN